MEECSRLEHMMGRRERNLSKFKIVALLGDLKAYKRPKEKPLPSIFPSEENDIDINFV